MHTSYVNHYILSPMPVYQQFLTVSTENAGCSVNLKAQEMILELKKEVKQNKSTRLNGNLIYDVVPAEYTLPRRISEEKEKTKWEKFAEEKGIKKKKKSRMVFSEKFNKWLPRYGSRSEQNLVLQGGVVEVEQSMSKMINQKKARALKNKKNAEKNKKNKRAQ